MRVIDAHVNITPDGAWFGTGHDASLERLLGEMEAARVDQALLIAMPGAADNRFVADVCHRYPERFRGLGHIVRWDRVEQEVAELRSMGLAGVKLHPRLQDVDVLDPRLETFWRLLEDQGVPVMIDGCYQNLSNGLPLYKLEPFYYDRLARRYPNLTIILAHAGAHRVWDAYWVARSNPNFYLDVSHVVQYFAGTSVCEDLTFVVAQADRKVMYGSDFPEWGLVEYRRGFEALCARRTDVDLDAVYHGNIERVIAFS